MTRPGLAERLDQARELEPIARAAILAQAAGPLPPDPKARERAGRRRLDTATRITAIELRQKHPGTCKCSPDELVEWIEGLAQAVQIIYRTLRGIGVIGPSGARS